MHQIPLRKSWVFTDIKGIRDVEKSATYHLFDYERLPPIEIKLDEKFDWLKDFPERLDKKDWEYDFSHEIKRMKKEAKIKGLDVPNSFYNFMGNGELIRRIY